MAWLASFFCALVVAAMIIVTAVVAGFQREIRAGLRTFEPDLTVHGAPGPRLFERIREELASEMGARGGPIAALAPRARCKGLAKSQVRDGEVLLPVTIVGIDWERDRRVLPGWDRMLDLEGGEAFLRELRRPAEGGAGDPSSGRDGSSPPAWDPFAEPVPVVLVGASLADSFRLVVLPPDVIEAPPEERRLTQSLLLASARRQPEGGRLVLRPNALETVFIGAVRSGRLEHDQHVVYVSREIWHELRHGADPDRPDCTEVVLRLVGGQDVETVQAALRARHPGLRFESWADRHRSFVEALQIEETLTTLMLFAIVVMGALLLLGVLSMLVQEKRQDLGILRALGMTAPRAALLFLAYGGVLGVLAVGVGTWVGVAVTRNLDRVTLFLRDRFGITVLAPGPDPVPLPWVLDANTVAVISASTLALVLLATGVVARRVAGLRVVQCLADR